MKLFRKLDVLLVILRSNSNLTLIPLFGKLTLFLRSKENLTEAEKIHSEKQITFWNLTGCKLCAVLSTSQCDSFGPKLAYKLTSPKMQSF